jgi:NAD(P) transhydrogenase subunit beta
VSGQLIQIAYLAAASLFILGLHNLGSPKTATRGNLMSAVGMGIAIVATLLTQGVVDFPVILAGIVVGSALGALHPE